MKLFRSRSVIVFAAFFFLTAFGIPSVFAFNGPSYSAGVGSGAIGVDTYNDVSIGTSTSNAAARFLIVASSTSPYSFEIMNAASTPIFTIDNNGVTSVAGTVTASAFVGALNGIVSAANIFSGSFGANTGGGNYSFSGNVGIGTTTPGYALDVQGGEINSSGGYCINGANCITSWPAGSFTGSGTANYIPLFASSTAFGNSVIYQSGSNVGIGTTTPGYMLAVNGTGYFNKSIIISAVGSTQSSPATVGFYNNASPQSQRWQFDVNDGIQNTWGGDQQMYGFWGMTFQGQRQQGPPSFLTGTSAQASVSIWGPLASAASTSNILNLSNSVGTPLDVVKYNGNVGIGTATPGYALDVRGGEINSSGGYCINGANCITSWPAGSFTGSGTANYIPLFASSTAFGNSVIYQSGSNVGIGTTTPAQKLEVNGGMQVDGNLSVGSNKITVGTIDPLYTIDGTNYATYLPGMTGQKEETAGTLQLTKSTNGNYSYAIDFTNQPKGSDLWLFTQATNLQGNGLTNLVVTLTPSFDGRVWYQKSGNTLTIYGDAAGEVSYNLTAPRFDAATWTNLAPASEASTKGFILNN